MAYLLDTDITIDRLNDDPHTRDSLNILSSEGLAISMVTYMEVYQGILGSPDLTRSQARFDAFLAEVPIIPFSVEVARRCAGLRAQLQQRRRRIRPRALDLIVAATALTHGLTLCTHNVADYRDIPELSLHRFDQS